MKDSLKVGLSAGLVAWMTIGCLAPGERAKNNQDDGWGNGGSGNGSGEGGSGGGGASDGCIPGEKCSSETPGGLYFKGASTINSFFQSGPEAIASGGTQKIGVYWDNQGNHPFDLPFDAATTDVLSVAGIDGSVVEVKAGGAGAGYLRLLEPGTDLLYDRIKLESMEATAMEVGPLEAFPFFKMDPPAKPWVLLASSATALAVSLHNGEIPLVDESAVLTVSGDATLDSDVSLSSWHSRWIKTGASGSVLFSVKLGSGKEASLSIPLVDKADDIVGVSSELGDPSVTTVKVGNSAYFCFRATSAGRPIAGATFEYSSSPGLSVEDFGLWPGCMQITGEKAGLGSFTIKAAGLSKTILFEAVNSTAISAPDRLAPRRAEPALRHGDRAGDATGAPRR